MQVTDYLFAQAAAAASHFKYPVFLWGIPILFVVLLFLITRNLVRYSLDEASAKKLRKMRTLVFLLRFASMSVLCLALATPFTELAKESAGDPHAVVLVDKSGSMGAYDTSFVNGLVKELGARLPTQVKEFGTDTTSPVGDALLTQKDHVLLISDGYATTGVDIDDVAQVARENKQSISTITLTPKQHDAAVMINAPASVPVGFPPHIVVDVTSTDNKPVPLLVVIDGKQAFADAVLGTVDLSPDLSPGYHKVEAHIASQDAISQNNDHYRVVQVLDKPKILVVAHKQGTLEAILPTLFETTTTDHLPDKGQLSQYYAIVLDDVPASQAGDFASYDSFLRDEAGGKYGGGLVVIGGFNSFDRGGYGGTQFETLLPVKIGKPKRSIGDNNIVFVIQVSGSTSATKIVVENGQQKTVTEAEPTIDVIKAQAVNAINSLNLKNNVGVVAFGISTAGQSFSSAEETLQHSVVKIADIAPLYNNKQDLVDKIPRITGGGTTAPDVALKTAVDMLKDKSGDKTIILLTNGRFSAGIGAGEDVPAKANTIAVIDNARKRYNIKTQTIGVGTSDDKVFPLKVDESFLKQAATVGDGTYDRATNLASLIVKYGDPKEKGFGESFSLVPLSLTHFITRNLDLTAVLNGYNEVTVREKTGGRMLVATDSGLPAVTVGNYINGRVATITVFSASGLGQLLEGNNSDLVRNTILWAVGDPSRKQDVKTEIKPAIIDHPAEVQFVSQQPIAGDCQDTPLTFERSSGNLYVFGFTPSRAGFGTACGVPYAVNVEPERWRTGINPQLASVVGVTDGGTFTPDQVDAIVDRIKTASTRVTVEKTELRNPLIVLALVIILIEIFMRRLLQYRK